MIRAILFDIDGVLLDSVKANAAFYRALFGHFGYPGPSDEEMQTRNHYSMRDNIAYYVPDADEARIEEIARHGDTVEAGYDLLEMPDEAPGVLADLARDFPLGLVSSRTRAGIEEYHQFAKLRHFFRALACFEDTEKHKPEPDPLWFAARQLGVARGETVYVGDAVTDIQAAKAAGMKMVLYAPSPLPGADATVGRFGDLPLVIRGLD